ncbi:alpha/beta hydrolase-fold protein [Nocardioides sp. SOB77]|uniref:Alpha/beta hydrolase-fold protein n=1 Tax=Nocardioides oceani TaxID=3058369 RepID=A0ABT8FCP2_9ACTN|nr:alpha/beta hydrolase-fold protein [Nocardioides oceani]MDN4171942.1 alpha/beta hydrolase-fold protein [Nocardioides oceani]
MNASVRRPRRALAALVGSVVLALVAAAGGPAAQADTGDDVVVEKSTTDTGDAESSWRSYLELMLVPSMPTDYQPSDESPGVDGPRACPPARCRDFRVPVPSDVKVTSNMVRVLFPVGYKAKKNKKKRYPVVYLFNGARSPYIRWSVGTELTAVTRPLKAIFVMPEGGIGDEAGMFSDWKDGSWQWETFHTEILTRWVDRKFRTSGKRGAVGASMGGLGAMAYPARHPGLYQAAFTLSGAVDTNLMVGNILPPEIAKAIGISPPNLLRVWGNPVLDRAEWDAHNPVALAPRLKGVELFVASGTGSSSTVSETTDPLHTGYTEQLMWTGHRTFLEALTRAGVPYSAWIRQGGVHNWPWFDAPLRWGLPKVVAALQ